MVYLNLKPRKEYHHKFNTQGMTFFALYTHTELTWYILSQVTACVYIIPKWEYSMIDYHQF